MKFKGIKEGWLLTAVLPALGVFFLFLLSQAVAWVGDADSLSHYKYARYAWQHPHFLLYHWGKPVFTLLASPFAQFGHAGVSVFNLLAGLASCVFAWLLARRFNYSFRLLIPFLILFTPIYASLVISGQVEILFGLFLVATSWLLADKRYLAAAVLISFSPMARTEGVFMIPVFALYLLYMRQFRALPLLLLGSLVYSVAGYFHYKDFFWLITEMPYRGAVDIYGKGSIWHFFRGAPRFFGTVMVVLMSLGLIRMLWQRRLKELLLIFLPFAIYFLGHAVMWWSGIGNSLGMHRYMLAIVPLGGLMALSGLNFLAEITPGKFRQSRLATALLALIMAAIVYTPFATYTIPTSPGKLEQLMKQSADYIRENSLNEHRLFYYDPAFFYFLDFNPFDSRLSRQGVYYISEPHRDLNEGDIIIWEGHLAALSGLSLDSLRANRCLEELARFEPEEPLLVFDTWYSVNLFRRLSDECLSREE